MIENLKTLLFRYINFSVCFSQVSRQQDNKIYWSITFMIGQIQLMLIPFLKYQNNRFIQLLIYITYPTRAYYDYVQDQLPLIILIILGLLVIWLITLFIIVFGQLSYSNFKLEQEDKLLTRKHYKLYQLYGKSDYLYLWFNISYHQKSFKLSLLKYTYLIINSFVICYFNPILYYSILLLDINDINPASFILLIKTLLFYFYCITFYSQSLTIYGSNYLSLQYDHFQLIILILQIMAFSISVFNNNQLIIQMIIFIVFILNTVSLTYNRLQQTKYKQKINLSFASLGICYSMYQIFKPNIIVLLLTIPLFMRLIITLYESEDLIQEYFLQPRNQNQNEYSIFQMIQINRLPGQQYYFYPHLIQQFDKFQFNACQYFSQSDQAQINIVMSKVVVRLIILINKHQKKCINNLCFCKDQYQNSIKPLSKDANTESNQNDQDVLGSQLKINLRFIRSFFQYHNKQVINKLINSQYIPVIQVNQILSYLTNSDNSCQCLFTLQELKAKLVQKNQKPQLIEQISLQFIRDYIKYNILEQKNSLINYETLNQIYNYDQFRSIQKLEFKLVDSIENNIKTKLLFLEKLESSSAHWFQQIENVSSSYNDTIQFIEDKLKINNIRTIYLYRLYFEMNLRNNLVIILKILQGLISLEAKFFEHPDSYYDLEYHSQEICYLKVDLNKSKQIDINGKQTRGQILDYSSNTPQFFKYSKSEFQLIQNIRDLMPQSAKMTHDEFIEIFIQSQKQNIIRNNIPLFSKAQTGLLIYTEFFCDYNFKQVVDEFTLHVFLKKIKDKGGLNLQQGYIWINHQNYIEGITKNIMQNLEIPYQQLFLLNSYKISELITDIQVYMNQLDQQLIYHQQQFGKKKSIQTSQIIFQLDLKELKFRVPSKLTQQQQKTYLLNGHIQLKYMKLIEQTYKVYIINIQNIVDLNEKFSFKLSIKTIQYEDKQLIQIGEEVDDDKDQPDDQYTKQKNNLNQYGFMKDPDSRQLNNENDFKEQKESYLFSLPQSDRQFIEQEEKFNSKQFTDTIQDIQMFKYKKQQKQVQESNYNSSTMYTEQNRIIIKSQFYERFSRIESKYTKYNFLLNILIFSTYITYIVIITGQLDEYLKGSKELIALISSTDNSDYAFNMMQFYNGIYNDTQINKSIQKLSAIIVEEVELLEEEVKFFDVMLNETAEHLLYDFLTLCKFQYTQVPYTKDLTQIILSFDLFFDWAEDLTEDINREMEELQEQFYIKITFNIVIQVVLTLTAAILFTTIIIKYESVISQIMGLQNLVTLNALKSEIKFNENLKGKLKYENNRRIMPIQIYEQQWDIQDKLVHIKDIEQQIQKINNQIKGNQKQRIDIKQLEFKQLIKQIIIGSFSLLLFTFISIPILIQILNYQKFMNQQVTIFKELIQLNEQITVIFASNQLILQELEQDVFEEQLQKGYDKYLLIFYQLVNKENKESIQDAFHQNLSGKYQNYTLYGAIQDLMKEIQNNQFKGFNYSQYQLYLIQEIYLSLEYIESQYLSSILTYIDQNFGQFQIIYTFFFSLLLIIQIVFAIIQQKRLKYRIKIISQLVFILPTISLYQEDLFYKTLQNISKTKQLLII